MMSPSSSVRTPDTALRTVDFPAPFDPSSATICPAGYMQVTDRSKDVIKSGGEWISSIDLENLAVGHPDVAEAAVIGVAHPKWDERPLLVIVPKAGRRPSKEEMLAFMTGKIAKWWLPDDVIMIESVPKTSVGKFDKKVLRAQHSAEHTPSA